MTIERCPHPSYFIVATQGCLRREALLHLPPSCRNVPPVDDDADCSDPSGDLWPDYTAGEVDPHDISSLPSAEYAVGVLRRLGHPAYVRPRSADGFVTARLQLGPADYSGQSLCDVLRQSASLLELLDPDLFLEARSLGIADALGAVLDADPARKPRRPRF